MIDFINEIHWPGKVRWRAARLYAGSAQILLCLLFVFGCNGKKDTIPKSSITVDVPLQEISNTTMFFYEGQRKQWKLEADHIRKELVDNGKSLVWPVRLTLFDSLGKQSTIVTADTGSIGSRKEAYFVWGNVYVRTSDTLTVRSQRLWWTQTTHKIESDTFVEMKTASGTIMRGKGLDATESFSRWEFKSQVSGEFPDFGAWMNPHEKKQP